MSRAADRPARGLLLAEGGLKLGDRVMSPLELELESLHQKQRSRFTKWQVLPALRCGGTTCSFALLP